MKKWSYCLFWECDTCVRMPPVLWVLVTVVVWWCGNHGCEVADHRTRCRGHSIGRSGGPADPLFSSRGATYVGHCPGLWGTKHYCWQSCIIGVWLSISYTQKPLLSPESLLKVLTEAWNTVACWTRHVVLLPITPHSVLPCSMVPPSSPSVSPSPPPPSTTQNPIFQTTEKTSSAAARHFTHISTKLPDR